MSVSTASDRVREPIVILIGQFERGGAQRQAFLLARELRAAHGLDVRVWGLVDGSDHWQDFEAAGIPTKLLHFQFPHRGWPQRCWPVLRELRKSRPGVVLPFTTWPNVVAGLTYKLAGVRQCIWGERHSGGERVPGMEHVAASQYRRFVANSTAGVDFLADEMRVRKERISLVPNGIEEPSAEPGPDWRQTLELEPDQLLVVKIANVTNYKDHLTLVRAWTLVQEAWPNGARPVLAMAGMFGDAYEECLCEVRDLGIEASVRFPGQVTKVPSLIRTADMAVFSSRKEGMPNGVLECMAAGKAVVATDLPGVRDALGPTAGEVVAPPGDFDQLARRLLDLLLDRDKRQAVGARNRARIQEEFSVGRMANRYLNVIRADAGERLETV